MADPTPPVLATGPEVEERRAAQEQEWGVYVATSDIMFGGVRAYNAGDSVPTSNVEKFKYVDQGLVAKVGTKAASAVITALHEQATAASDAIVTEPVSLGVPVPTTK